MRQFCFILSILGLVVVKDAVKAQPPSVTDRETFLRLHESLERVREEIYGNCSYSVTETVVYSGTAMSDEGGKPHVILYKFWARENQFIRVDIFEKAGSNKPTQRYVIRPEGSIRLTANDNGDMVVSHETLFAFYQSRIFQFGVVVWKSHRAASME
jgi:hypothetical protein